MNFLKSIIKLDNMSFFDWIIKLRVNRLRVNRWNEEEKPMNVKIEANIYKVWTNENSISK